MLAEVGELAKGIAIAGANLLPISVIANIAIIGLIQVGLDLYQGHPPIP